MFCVMVWLREGVSRILRGGFLVRGGRRMRVFSAVVLFVRKKKLSIDTFSSCCCFAGVIKGKGFDEFNQFVLVFFGYLLECRVEMNEAMSM